MILLETLLGQCDDQLIVIRNSRNRISSASQHPEKPEQAEWLNSLADVLTETWDCQWTFKDTGGLERFAAILKGFGNER